MAKKKSADSILIVEDDEILRKVLSNALKREKYTVFQAENGKEGLKVALKEHPKLILLDLIMPVMDGKTMLKMLREDEWGKEAYVLMFTNLEPSEDLIEEASRMPYRSSYLMKSEFGMEDVLKLVKKQIGKG